MLIELLLAGQLGATSVPPTFHALRDEAAAQESALTVEQRNALSFLRGKLFSQAMGACRINPGRTLEFQAVAEVRDGKRLKVVGRSESASGCIVREIERAPLPKLDFMPKLLRFDVSYAPDRL